MKMSNENTQIIKALLKVQEEIQNPKKTEENPYYKSKYAPLDQILNEVRVLLSKHGLVMIQDTGGDDEGNVVVSTTLLHESGGWIQTSPLIVKPTARKASATPQEMGSAITYARRYQLMSLLGIVGEDEDDDGERASHPRASQGKAGRPHPQRPSPPPKPAPATARRKHGGVKLGVLSEEDFSDDKELKALIMLTRAEKGEATLQNVLMALDELHADGRVTEEEYMNMKKKLGVKT